MKPIQRRSRIKHRPIEVEADFLVPADHATTIAERELVFLSKDVEAEFIGQEYVAIALNATIEGGWTILRLGRWEEGESQLKGKSIVISGLGSDFQKRFYGKVLLQSVTPAPLDTVVFKVVDLDYDTIAADYESFRQLQIDGTVFRAGKPIIFSNGCQLKVALCEPVQQGTLGDDTEVILVTDTEYEDNIVNGLGTPYSVTSQNDANSDLDISRFLSLPSSEEDLDYELSVTEDTILLPPYDDSTSRGIPLRICVLERPIDKFSLDPRPVDSEDDQFRVYAHMRDVAHIGVFSGDWVSIILTFLI
jgi:hypothetical protein